MMKQIKAPFGAPVTVVYLFIAQAQALSNIYTTTVGAGGAYGDPLITDFAGRTFTFKGEAGAAYNVIEDDETQVSMLLKAGSMRDHDGTYIESVGYAFQEHTVLVELLADDSIAVTLNGMHLNMARGENSQQHDISTPEGQLHIDWQLFRPEYGNTVELTTDLLRLTIFRTDAAKSSLDSTHHAPAHLNFDAQLLHPPAHELKGLVGEGYARMLAGEGNALPDDQRFYGDLADYQMPFLFPEAAIHPAAASSAAAGARASRRRLGEVATKFGADIAALSRALSAGFDLPIAPSGGSRKLLVGY